MVVDWDWDSSGLELDRRELVLGWRGGGWRYLQKQRAYQPRWYGIAERSGRRVAPEQGQRALRATALPLLEN